MKEIEEAIREVNSFKLLYMEGISDNGMVAIKTALAALRTMEKVFENMGYVQVMEWFKGFQKEGAE